VLEFLCREGGADLLDASLVTLSVYIRIFVRTYICSLIMQSERGRLESIHTCKCVVCFGVSSRVPCRERCLCVCVREFRWAVLVLDSRGEDDTDS
jgi:hypothetical protein